MLLVEVFNPLAHCLICLWPTWADGDFGNLLRFNI